MTLYPKRSEFLALARTYNLIPVYREILADMETPVSALNKLGADKCAYLLESVEGGEKLGRYSFLGVSARRHFYSFGSQVTVEEAGESRTFISADPLEALAALLHRFRPASFPGLPRFIGGAVGYIAYDMVKCFERLTGRPKAAQPTLPDCYFYLTDCLLIFDHTTRRLKILVNAEVPDPASAGRVYEEAAATIDDYIRKLSAEPGVGPLLSIPMKDAPRAALPALTSTFTKEDFMAATVRAKEYIAAGEAFQIVLSQRLAMPVTAPPFLVYRLLRALNPSPYLFYLQFPRFALIGSSPEVMVRLEDGEAVLRPIAGTRPRGENQANDIELAQELLRDEKELAEHTMLVDLGRNDLGRVCSYGSVQVDEYLAVERYSHVMHLVSNIKGRLAPGYDAFALLRATFPAGTVSGAPKIKAMEIIDELEPVKRGPYAGAVGYFSFNGNMDTCITIRTIVMADGYAYLQAGAGIVADSDPEKEYEETRHKAQALIKTIELAEGAIRP
ncbi:MAG TPA: anthranilate synthase component I [Firmicutes bacterium]|nr:anthranilate synthase component I [Bacillota bacterium]